MYGTLPWILSYFLRTKKHNSVALSIAEAEYVEATECRSQLLWIKQHFEDFEVSICNIPENHMSNEEPVCPKDSLLGLHMYPNAQY